MKNAFCLSAVIIFVTGFASAQSGRRVVTPKATPTPSVERTASTDAKPYSESTPAPTRRLSAAERFPKIGDGSGSAATPAATQPAGEEDSDVLKVETDLITIPVSVYDRNGLYIPGLTKDDFKVFEDGKEQQIAYFGTSDKPFTVMLLLDTSPSTDYKIDEIRDAARAFVDQLKPVDNVIVVEFDGNVHVLTEATNDRDKIYKAIRKADFGSGTSIYDSVWFALTKRLNKIEGRKAIVLFTDGVDTTSHKSDYDRTVDMAEESDSMIFPIYFNTYLENKKRIGGGGFPPVGGTWSNAGTTAEDYARGREYLNDLATYTGGRVFRPESTPGGLTAAFEGIAEELRRQYSIGYVPTDEGTHGQRKRIKVRVDRPNLVVRSRDSYIVGAAPTPATPAAVK